ncbi:hypothetical protein SOQ_02161, partial [Enterococcus faecalis EnGen0206]
RSIRFKVIVNDEAKAGETMAKQFSTKPK